MDSGDDERYICSWSFSVRLHRGQGWQAAAQVGGTLVPNWKLVAECAELLRQRSANENLCI